MDALLKVRELIPLLVVRDIGFDLGYTVLPDSKFFTLRVTRCQDIRQLQEINMLTGVPFNYTDAAGWRAELPPVTVSQAFSREDSPDPGKVVESAPRSLWAREAWEPPPGV